MERLADLRPNADEAARRAESERPEILILPGSRRSEINHLMPAFGQAVALIAAERPQARFVLPAVTHLRALIGEAVASWPVKPEIVIGEVNKLAAFRGARAALAASGTVTLELALAQIPTVAAYRGANWEAAIAKRLIKLPSVILPNLILGHSVVPEFIQETATPETLSREVLAIIPEGEARARQLAGFDEVETIMRSAGASPAANAVEAALALLASDDAARV
jgi:lipid-A-disaccharide synthase